MEHFRNANNFPAIFRIVSLEDAAKYQKAIAGLGETVSANLFPIRSNESLRELATASAQYEIGGKQPSKRAVDQIVENLEQRMLSIDGDAIGIVIHSADPRIEMLPFEIERLTEKD